MELQDLLGSSFGHLGPVAWCKRCSRKHRRGTCNLIEVERVAKSGRKVKRWAHSKARPKAEPKRKARRS